MRVCPICNSDRVFLWLGGISGSMYQCSDCHYVGPVIIDVKPLMFHEKYFKGRDLLMSKTLWSETGVAGSMLVQHLRWTVR